MTAPQFEALLALQEIDTALEQVRHRRDHLPARAELADVAAGRRQLAARRAADEATRDEVDGSQAALEAELAATEKRSRDVSSRLYGGQVSAARELQTLAADIDILKQRSSGLEDRILEVLEEREPIDAAIVRADADAAAFDDREAAATAARAEGEREADAEAADLGARRQASADLVTPELAAIYERLRPQLGGIAVARLVGRHCDGCHLELPATELDHARHMPEDEVAYCDQCGRILVRS